LDAFKALKHLKPSIPVAVNDTPAFVIKGWSDIFVPFLKPIFNQRLFWKYFPTLQKQAEIIYLKKGNNASVSNYRPISLLNNFSKSFEFGIHDHIPILPEA
jgi:hypothetical protein